MKIKLFVFLFLFAVSSFNTFAQTAPTENQKKIIASVTKKWKIIRYETFGVPAEPKAEQKNDYIQLNQDMSFILFENGKEYTGKWSILPPNDQYINCKGTGFNKTYKIISIGEKETVIQFKDPDLIKTDYFMITE